MMALRTGSLIDLNLDCLKDSKDQSIGYNKKGIGYSQSPELVFKIMATE
jgi:hypothetical protein